MTYLDGYPNLKKMETDITKFEVAKINLSFNCFQKLQSPQKAQNLYGL